MQRSVLEQLSPTQRERLLARAVRRDLPRGELLQLAGSPAERVHLIVTGIVSLSVRDIDGDETILGLAGPGTFVGEVAAIDGEPQPFDAATATAAQVVGFDAAAFVDIVFSSPPAARALAALGTARSRWMIDTALERTTGEVDARLAGRLLDLSRMLGRTNGTTIELELPLSQRDLGRLAGMCRESACKTLRRMKANGIVDYEGRKLRILRPDSLRMLKCGGSM
ncbi:MAG TPA: Crp/Fnr family transcriptional regulator [Actinomycetota bacterium]|nr:Crp/Fnr family transcriptional regulator [Actinomycetota bacterium]